MQCIGDGCEREATYKRLRLCQKHYFRLWRNGSTELKPTSRIMRLIAPNGYAKVFDKDHALADSSGYVFEHRHVMWPIVGPDCRPCELCGKSLSWKTCHIDHIDNIRLNNNPSNLRVLCCGCNTKRGFTPESYRNRSSYGLIEFEGRRDTAEGWAKDPRVSVAGHVIRQRKRRGMSDYDALFMPKLTHNGAITKEKESRKNDLQKLAGTTA